MLQSLKFYNCFFKGIRFQPTKVQVTFNISIPNYMHFISHEATEYMGWELYFFKQYVGHKKWEMRCTKELSLMTALVEAIWFRKEVAQSFKPYNPKPVHRRSKIRVMNDWLEDQVNNLIKEEEKYVSRSFSLKNNN